MAVRSPETLIRTVRRVIPDIERVEALLTDDPDAALLHCYGPRGAAAAADGRDAATVGLTEARAPSAEFHAALDGARSALRKVAARGQQASLEEVEVIGLEAVVLAFGRPAILVQDGHFFPAPHPWERLEDYREPIERIMQSVGRIEITGHPSLDWIGTGFLVDTDVVLTNRHVVKEFVEWDSRGRWKIDQRMRVRIDFAEELGGPAPKEFRIASVIGIHRTFDLALLRIDATVDNRLPPPLRLARPTHRAQRGRQVYVVGYPASDSRRNNEADVQRVFGGIFNVKRLQPGTIRSWFPEKAELTHDCSTLGGNSGSCVVDLETNRVVGVHFRGRYLEANWAVDIGRLASQVYEAAARDRV